MQETTRTEARVAFADEVARATAGVSSVAGRQAQIDAACGCTRKAADDRTGDGAVVSRVGNERTCRSSGEAARSGVLQAAGKGQGEKADDEE